MERVSVKSFGPQKNGVQINKDSWKELRTILLRAEDFARIMIEKHGMSTPNAEGEGGFD